MTSTNVQDAIDEIYAKTEAKECATGYEKQTINSNSYKCEKPLVCKRATTLHSNGSSTYGSLGTSGTLAIGDAFDCDVNKDKTYNSTDERFYYIGTDSNNNAILLYYKTETGGYGYSGVSSGNGGYCGINDIQTYGSYKAKLVTKTLMDTVLDYIHAGNNNFLDEDNRFWVLNGTKSIVYVNDDDPTLYFVASATPHYINVTCDASLNNKLQNTEIGSRFVITIPLEDINY